MNEKITAHPQKEEREKVLKEIRQLEKTRTNHIPIDMRSLCFFGRFAQVERYLQRYGYNSLGRNLFTFSVAL